MTVRVPHRMDDTMLATAPLFGREIETQMLGDIIRVIEDSNGDARAALSELGRVFTSETFAAEYRGRPFINASAEFAAPSHPARVLAAAQRAWIADTLERLLRAMGHRAPARTARQLLMLQTGPSLAWRSTMLPGWTTSFSKRGTGSLAPEYR
jgi:hypothetical protein